MEGAFILGTMFDVPLIITLLVAIRFRSIFLVVLVIGLGSKIIYDLASYNPALSDQLVLGQLFIAILLHRTIALFRGYAFIDDNHGIMPFLYRRLPFTLVDWKWHERMKMLLNGATCWLDRLALVLIPGTLAYAFISSQRDYLQVIPGYALAWVLYLYFLAYVMALEAAARFLYTLTRPGNFNLLVAWIAAGLRNPLAIISKPCGRFMRWFTDGFKGSA